MGVRTAIPLFCLLATTGAGCGLAPAAAPAREAPPPPGAVVSVPPAAVPAASSATPTSSPPVAHDSDYYVWLKSELAQPQTHVLDHCLVVTGGVGEKQAPRRAFVLDREGLLEEPRLEQGLAPRGPVIGLSGDWPRAARVEIDTNAGGYACPVQLAWDGTAWQPIDCGGGCCGDLPDWFQPGGDTYTMFQIPWTGGRTLYERFHLGTRESTFLINGDSKRPARLQRARCGAGPAPRLQGSFSGTRLPSGVLVGVGADCQTGLASAETWAVGASRSVVRALPGPFKMFVPPGPYDASATYYPHGGSRLYVSYLEPVTDWEMRPRIVHFDGQAWTDLACPAKGDVFDTLITEDGAVWVAAYQEEGWKVWTHPGATRPGSWTDATPNELSGLSQIAKSAWTIGPTGDLFIAAASLLLEHRAGNWAAHPLPRVRSSDEQSPRYRARELHWTPWGELVVESWDEDQFVLLRAVKRQGAPLR